MTEQEFNALLKLHSNGDDELIIEPEVVYTVSVVSKKVTRFRAPWVSSTNKEVALDDLMAQYLNMKQEEDRDANPR